MIIPEKTFSSNPFVDNIIYYAKYMALNCTVKDEEEALANETKESLYAGDLYIACIEGIAMYEAFDSIPKEILEKYIAYSNNLDIYAKDPLNLKTRLNNFSAYERQQILNRLSSLARTVYIDHFDTMSSYVSSAGNDWLTRNANLYTRCTTGVADYNELFDVLPLRTNLRIIKAYFDPYEYVDLASIWDPESRVTKADIAALQKAIRDAEDSGTEINYDTNLKPTILRTDYITSSPGYSTSSSLALNQLRAYFRYKEISSISQEIEQLSAAMRSVFASHYEIMRDRQYFSNDINNTNGTSNQPSWMDYYFDRNTFEACKNGTATYYDLFNFFPKSKIIELLSFIPTNDITDFHLDEDVEALRLYFTNYSIPQSNINTLSTNMRKIYVDNYQLYLNQSIYYECQNGIIDIYGLYPYLPPETLKSIIATEIPMVSNIQTYSESKDLLNSYLNTLPPEQANTIKNNISKDMLDWYPKNHIEKNNYYRHLIGLPPMGADGSIYEDSLVHTWDAKTGSFIEFGDRFISKIPTNIYPAQHWKIELYKLDAYDLSILNEYGIIEEYVSACGSSLDSERYRYLKYLGDNKLNLYECRKGGNFSLIGMPAVDDYEAKSKFMDAFVLNSDYVIRVIYSEAYKFQSTYYNKFIIIFILMNTIMDMLGGISDLIINRDVFDDRCIKYMFEAYGVPYFSEIPIKYQQAMLKNLNTLLKYKSSTKNMIDICNLFGFSDIKVFGYYLMKDREKNADGYIPDEDNDISYPDQIGSTKILYVRDESNGTKTDITGSKFTPLKSYRYYQEDYYYKTVHVKNGSSVITKKILRNDRDVYVYDATLNQMIPLKDTAYFTRVKANTSPSTLKFVRVPIEESLTEYKKDTDNIFNYDDITSEITWDGGDNHELIKRQLLEHEFNAVKSKYISIETATDLTDISFQMSYFYNMIFDNAYNEDQLTLQVPAIQQNHNFRLTDLLFYLFALTYYYHGLEDKIMYSPTQILYIKGYNFDEAINAVMNDPKEFSQTDSNGRALTNAEKKSIFDINTRIAEDNYDYLARFDRPTYRIKGFNLNADIDELEAWLQKEWQMSLDDFIVSEDIDEFGQILTLRQFYTLKNTYYQKSIFNGTMHPSAFNNLIKYAYAYELLPRVYINDTNLNSHSYIQESFSEDDINRQRICVNALVARYSSSYDYPTIVSRGRTASNFTTDLINTLTNKYGITNQSIRNKISALTQVNHYSEIITTNSNEEIYVMSNELYAQRANSDARGIFNRYIRSGSDYISATNQYYIIGSNGYELLVNGRYNILDNDGRYIFAANNLYRLENRTYIQITDSRYFTSIGSGKYKLKTTGDYVLDYDETYYFDYNTNEYRSISDGIYEFKEYDSPMNVLFILIRQRNYDYNKYAYDKKRNRYCLVNTGNLLYTSNSDSKYITLLNTGTDYNTTKSLIIVLDKSMSIAEQNLLSSSDEYNPSLHDGVWDENDWFYDGTGSNPNNTTEMHGENIWYYSTDQAQLSGETDDSETEELVGSGLYIPHDEYIKNIFLEVGSEYYFSLDIEPNFNGEIFIFCTADTNYLQRTYSVHSGEVLHINQVFKANRNTADLRIIKQNFSVNPISIGDYVVVSNVRFSKAFSEHYIPTDIPSIDELQSIYKTNTAIYKWLNTQMHNTSEKRMYDLYKRLYDSLMISSYNKEIFRLGPKKYARTYTEFIESRDEVLYEQLIRFKGMEPDAMKKAISDNIIEVVYSLNEVIDSELKYIYSYFPAVSIPFVHNYIYKVINWFKSWKVHLLGINTIYRMGNGAITDENGNIIAEMNGDDFTIKFLHDERYKIRIVDHQKDGFIYGSVKINPIDGISPDGIPYSDKYDFSDSVTHIDDSVGLRDRIRLIVTDSNGIRFVNDEMYLHLTDDSTNVTVENGNKLKVTTINGDVFYVSDGNELHINTDESSQDVFSSQMIDEINLLSGDYIEYPTKEEDDE